MRSPKSFVVTVRRKNGDIVIRERPWHSVWERLRFLRWPFLRGAVVLIEALHNGISALTFSANQAAEDEVEAQAEEGASEDDAASDSKKQEGELSGIAITLMIVFALGVGLFFFLVLPHFLTWLIGTLAGVESLKDGQSAPFHVVDGVIKVSIFLAYVWGISFMPDIKRVFQYHGAEHKAIFAHEAGQELTVENARAFTTLHPRCGTSFILIVVLMSIFVFFAVLPFLPTFSETAWLNQLVLVAVKLPLMFPIAGLAYEIQRLSARTYGDHPIVRALIWPGLMLQKITTQPPTDEQLEVALVSVRRVLQREREGAPAVQSDDDELERYGSFAEFAAASGQEAA